MATYMSDKDIQEYLQEGFEEDGETIEAAFDYLLGEVRDLFEMNTWDEPNFTELHIPFQGKIYNVSIESDGCCEATHEHRIMYWKHTVTEVK
tara:strand:+ start:1047 stop:1322 length:276 start_codon:yes stop_codon:yes gene_type:complete